MTASARERRSEIVLLAHTSGLASVEELSRRFEVTASTIRRDLARLTSEGKIARTYGGAMAINAQIPEPTFRQRHQEAAEAKRAIARYARTLVHDGETVLLDAGSTVAALAHELREDISLTVATTSLAVLEELAEADGVHVECLGGTLRHPSQGFVGPLTEAALERMTYDRVFLGADGVTADGAICEADLQQTRLKELMCRRAREVVVLADASKLGRAPFHAWARLPAGWILVTDPGAAQESLRPFLDAGVDVRLAEWTGRASDEVA
ncbi:DeoR/GlpR family DNA-binding transcription regulator [Arthrobacter mobilis]|uniref:DeoR/GlpR transcriptional regulator n=1 Tax=Arthrobacter mobilis TaxID=2724944 RepID=A0A7X6K4L9_9MICC|nr:DeoR/GlpR family DNA-binding transcription regulator [Arthrobacter mobilis]NKX54775.1 DeoR/GlpR transcriptional regulator [Arthrobacter mobilis]